ncbi:MAG: hypothetical protein K9H65_04475, partial [Bacteroidales bacterium]|nr:hypothetical protein [Bacteroidales bacterium]
MNHHLHKSKVDQLLKSMDNIRANLSTDQIIRHVITNEEAIVSESGALATWTSKESTGRSPEDTVIV